MGTFGQKWPKNRSWVVKVLFFSSPRAKPLEVPFFLVRKWALLAKSDQKKWHFEWPNQNSKTTFIVQTFPKNGLYDFYLANLSLLGAILAIFQFCGFSGLFWPFFPCKKCKNENLSPHFNFWSITLKFFLWTPTTHEPEWLRELSSIQKKCKNGTPYCLVKIESTRERWHFHFYIL